MGDINVDCKLLNKHENEKNNYEKTFNKRVKTIQSQLLSNNFTQQINEDTRNGKILDHIYSNNMSKIFKSYIESDSSSDHKYITLEKKDEDD